MPGRHGRSLVASNSSYNRLTAYAEFRLDGIRWGFCVAGEAWGAVPAPDTSAWAFGSARHREGTIHGR